MTTLREAAQNALEALESVYGDSCDALHALRAALAQQAEPVAWVRLEAWKSGKDWPDDCFTALPAEGLTPLYTAPPQRKPLTDEEIRDLWSWSMTAEAERTATTQQHAFTRAVERAHGITGDESC